MKWHLSWVLNVNQEYGGLVTKSDSCNPMGISHQAPLSMGFPRQEYQHGLPFPSFRKSTFPLQGIFLTQGLNLHLLHCRCILYLLSFQGSPIKCTEAKKKRKKEKDYRSIQGGKELKTIKRAGAAVCMWEIVCGPLWN